MTVHLSVDIETMSTRANAVVLSIGLCLFDDSKTQSFEEIVDSGVELFFDADEQIEKYNRHVSPSTLDWWKQQGEEARRCFEPEETITPREIHSHFEAMCDKADLHLNWFRKHGKTYSRGNSFDIGITDDLFADYGVTPIWKYYNVRDIRTWLECHGLESNLKLVKPDSMIPHNALHDAAFDAYMMQQCLHVPFDKLNKEEIRSR